MSTVAQGPVASLLAKRHRLMLIGRSGLFIECLSRIFSESGFETELQPISDPIRSSSVAPDLAVFCVNQFDPDLLAPTRQRIGELHSLTPDLPIMMLFEQAGLVELGGMAHLGITATVVGVPSITVAVAAVQFVMSGGPHVTTEIRLEIRGAAVASEPSHRAGLVSEATGLPDRRFTERETAVLEGLRQGQPNKIIAHALGVSESTVKVHLRSIMTKLKVRNRTQIICTLTRPGEGLGESPNGIVAPSRGTVRTIELTGSSAPSLLVDPSVHAVRSVMSELSD